MKLFSEKLKERKELILAQSYLRLEIIKNAKKIPGELDVLSYDDIRHYINFPHFKNFHLLKAVPIKNIGENAKWLEDNFVLTRRWAIARELDRFGIGLAPFDSSGHLIVEARYKSEAFIELIDSWLQSSSDLLVAYLSKCNVFIKEDNLIKIFSFSTISDCANYNHFYFRFKGFQTENQPLILSNEELKRKIFNLNAPLTGHITVPPE